MSVLQEMALGEKYRTLRFASGILLYLAILVFGSIPGARVDIGHMASGVVLHTAAYSTIAFLLFSGCRSIDRRNATRVFLAVAAMGAVDEMIQTVLVYRTGEITDWLVDVSAAFLTVLIMLKWFNRYWGNDSLSRNERA